MAVSKSALSTPAVNTNTVKHSLNIYSVNEGKLTTISSCSMIIGRPSPSGSIYIYYSRGSFIDDAGLLDCQVLIQTVGLYIKNHPVRERGFAHVDSVSIVAEYQWFEHKYWEGKVMIKNKAAYDKWFLAGANGKEITVAQRMC